MDGFGFHEGYFHWQRSIRARVVPHRLSERGKRCFDQGLGRSLWFVDGADAERIHTSITSFPEHRRGDLWSGIGLACAYAGGVERESVEWLQRLSGKYSLELAQGATFAAKARERAQNPAPHTELACLELCGLTATEAARVTDEAFEEEQQRAGHVDYESWRQQIRNRLAASNTALLSD